MIGKFITVFTRIFGIVIYEPMAETAIEGLTPSPSLPRICSAKRGEFVLR